MKNCPFCYPNPKRNKVLEETEMTKVIFSNPRLMPYHLLVIPKRHVAKLSELTLEERNDLLETVVRYQEVILEKVAKGCDTKQHYRPFLENSDLKQEHLHFHLQPRELNDELYQKCQIFETDVFEFLSPDEVASLE